MSTLIVSLALSYFASHGLEGVSARADDSIVGTWSWFTGPDVHLSDNKEIHLEGLKGKRGEWEDD